MSAHEGLYREPRTGDALWRSINGVTVMSQGVSGACPDPHLRRRLRRYLTISDVSQRKLDFVAVDRRNDLDLLKRQAD